MTKFVSIQEWLKSSPSQDEINKLLALINKGAVSSIRKAVYEKENFLRKLYRSSSYLEKVGIKANKELTDQIKQTKIEIAELKKDLPAPVKKSPRAKEEVVH